MLIFLINPMKRFSKQVGKITYFSQNAQNHGF